VPPDSEAGGLMRTPDPKMKPIWLGYVGVDDVDKTCAKLTKLGGAIHMPPTDMLNVGRLAMVADPQGLMFYVMRGASPEESHAFKPKAVGHCGWNELATSDPLAAQSFYGELFGWTKGEAMKMGEMGDYTFLLHHGQQIGATMKAPPGMPPMWRYYFRVAAIDAAARNIKQHDRRVTQGPTQVPGGDYVVNGSDPQGALFALVGPK
jgi:predicted enzyme related to lactoylglutathione lyase